MNKKRVGATSAIPTVVSIAMVLFMLGLLLILVFNAHKQSVALLENVEMTVMFKPDAREDSIQQIKRMVELNPKVKSVVYVSKEVVNKNFAEEVGKDFVSTIGYYPLGSELRIYLKSDFASEASLLEIKSGLLGYGDVRDIVYKANLLDKINKNVREIGGVLLGLCVIFILVSIALINGTIRLGLFSERFSIKTMQLVGATDWFIMKPFIGRALRHGFYGAVISLLLLAVAMYGVYTFSPQLVTYLEWVEYGAVAVALAAFGFLLTMVSSYFVTRKYLRVKIDDLY